jgi:hypothetical protein
MIGMISELVIGLTSECLIGMPRNIQASALPSEGFRII